MTDLKKRLREHARKGRAKPRNFPPYYREGDEDQAADEIERLEARVEALVGLQRRFRDEVVPHMKNGFGNMPIEAVAAWNEIDAQMQKLVTAAQDFLKTQEG